VRRVGYCDVEVERLVHEPREHDQEHVVVEQGERLAG
jgi:hypothetical protein